MKKVLTFIFSGILAVTALEFQCAAQNYVAPPVTVSSTTVERGGAVYYEHTVLAKQTLYSISRAYDVNIDEIYAANEGLKESGLKKGSVIYIPAKGSVGVSDDNGAKSASFSEENPANDAVSEKNSTNSGKNNAKSASIDGDGTAAKGKKSAVKQTDFEKRTAEKKAARNAEREKRKGRKNRQTPTTPDVVEEPEPEPVEQVEEGQGELTVQSADSTEFAELLAKARRRRPSFLKKDDVCATLLLPFNAGSGAGNDLSMDFYSGALLAMKHLSEDEGISLYVNVFDSYGDALPAEKDLNYSDFIVGMLSKNGFGEVLRDVPQDCRVVSPLDVNTLPLAEDHANFFQCSNSTAAQYADMAQWLVEEHWPEDRILIIHEKSLLGTDQAEEVGAALDRCGLPWTTFSYSILDGRDINESLVEQMTEEGVNRVIVATSNEAFANDAIRNLNVLIHSNYKIVLYGGSKIRGFENIPVENLHNVNFHASQSFHIDYDDPRVQRFLMEYRALYNTEPSQTAFQGYDIMYYFTMLNRRVRSGRFVERDEEVSLLMSDFEFERCGEKGGYVRTGIRRTVYEPNYSIKYLK